MGKIRTLPDLLVSKISAGEIVENPASVIKELVENSIDAGAARISIHLESGGRTLVKVIDNGCGMSRDDALMSIERHATSKIKDIDDLFSIGTLGFRGEAIPSIASVSRFRMITAAEGSKSGTDIYIEGGIVRKIQETAAPAGSSVEVKNLFFNTPARRKFLKNSETEMARSLEVIQREALAKPHVAFEIFSNGKTVYRYGSVESLEQRASQIIPRVSLYSLDFEDETVRVHGFLASPLDVRSSMRRLYTYVNGRPVRDRFINRTIMNCYGKMIEKGKYPQGVLFIERDPRLVDVNVSPAKSEVMFQNQYLVGQGISRAVDSMLSDAPWMKSHTERAKKALVDFYRKQQKSSDISAPHGYAGQSSPKGTSTEGISFSSGSESSTRPSASSEKHRVSPAPPEEEMFSGGFYSTLKFLGQVGKLYLVCESPDGVILIDQHAAHERVRFERIKKTYTDDHFSCSQELLIPEVLDLGVDEITTAERFTKEIKHLGFDFEVFGENTVRIRSAPEFLRGSDYRMVFSDLLDELDEIGDAKSLMQRIDTVCATMACHSSITANRTLSEREVEALFQDMDSMETPHFCPHGRPVSTKISYNMLEKMFKRG